MKTLYVVYGVNQEILETAEKKCWKLKWEMGGEVDLCIYAEQEDLKRLPLRNLKGKKYLLEISAFFVEKIGTELCEIIKQKGYTSIVIADGMMSGELAVYLASQLKRKCVTAVVDLRRTKGKIKCRKMVYNNRLCAEYELPEQFVVSERLRMESKHWEQTDAEEEIYVRANEVPDYLIEEKVIEKRLEKTLSPILIAVGMGVEKREEGEKIREYAKKEGYSFGVSRPVAMRGWAKIGEIIGVSGEIYAPKITVAIGISGAAAFMAGIEQSTYILAINLNPDATITQHADAVIVEKYQNVLQSVFESIKRK